MHWWWNWIYDWLILLYQDIVKNQTKGPFAQKPQKWVWYLWTCPESRTAIKNENEFFLWWVDKNNNIIRQSCSRRLLKELICQRRFQEKKNTQLYETLYQSMNITVWYYLSDGDKNIEEKLQEKVCRGRSRKLSVSGKPIMTKTLYDVPSTDNPTSQGTFVARRGWLQKFMSVWIIFQLRSIIISFFIHGFWLTEYLHVKGHTEFSLYVLIFLCQKYLK